MSRRAAAEEEAKEAAHALEAVQSATGEGGSQKENGKQHQEVIPKLNGPGGQDYNIQKSMHQRTELCI